MSELYLILHKVRGQPAFDIAYLIADDLWIIPTSGHRAHPKRYWKLDDLACVDDYPHIRPAQVDVDLTDWPDHYQVGEEPKVVLTNARSLLAKLGLAKPSPAPTRRRLT